jgi:hypothetical protein
VRVVAGRAVAGQGKGTGAVCVLLQVVLLLGRERERGLCACCCRSCCCWAGKGNGGRVRVVAGRAVAGQRKGTGVVWVWTEQSAYRRQWTGHAQPFVLLQAQAITMKANVVGFT